MKRLILFTLILSIYEISFSQTNTFPATGNVGIGTTVPQQKLEIEGGHGDANFLLHSTNDAYLSLWASEPGWTYTGTGIGNNINGSAYYGRINTGRGASYIRLLDNSLYFNTVNASGTDINNMFMSDGNVGIGTTTPLAKLHVSTDINLGSSTGNNVLQMVVRGVANNNIYRKEWTYRESAGSDWLTAGWFDGIDIDGVFSTPMSDTKCWYKRIPYGATLRHAWGDGSTTFLDIYYNGNVGIGTLTPQNKLDVAGTIRCTEVKVEALPWADFVFHPSYKLRSLGEVEQFIKANNHLPEIPTAKEVKENGVGLGEMNAKLLQKVEELTLYIIQKDKENKIQDDKIRVLEEEIKKIKENQLVNNK